MCRKRPVPREGAPERTLSSERTRSVGMQSCVRGQNTRGRRPNYILGPARPSSPRHIWAGRHGHDAARSAAASRIALRARSCADLAAPLLPHRAHKERERVGCVELVHQRLQAVDHGHALPHCRRAALGITRRGAHAGGAGGAGDAGGARRAACGRASAPVHWSSASLRRTEKKNTRAWSAGSTLSILITRLPSEKRSNCIPFYHKASTI